MVDKKRLRDRASVHATAIRAPLTRRELLQGVCVLGAASFTPAIVGCGDKDDPDPPDPPVGPETLFQHGVASGDPLPDAIILWTRVTGDTDAAVKVSWEIATDTAFKEQVKAGIFETNRERDFTVKVDVGGLSAGTTYYYRFKALGRTSPIGRTRTAPSGTVDRLRFAVVSCSSYGHGYFHSYRALAGQLDLDAIIHLGDYIYEYADYGMARAYEPPREILTLDDYRMRHALYKREPDLQAVHRQHPFITVWDDHETADNSYKDGAENHTEGTEGSWVERKAAGLRAYAEWMPIREQTDTRIFRKLAYGNLVDLVMLDTRLWGRNKPGGPADAPIIGPPPEPDPTRTLLGDEQEAWFLDQVTNSQARWKLIGQQVMVGNLVIAPGTIANYDQWHGYPESRKRLLDVLRSSAGNNAVVLTGDIHSSWANELVNDPVEHDEGRGSVGVEFVAPAVTSPGLEGFEAVIETARPFNPHIRWFDPVKRGYLLLDVTPDRVQGAWFLFPAIDKPEPISEAFAAAWSVANGTRVLTDDMVAALPRADAPAAAPA